MSSQSGDTIALHVPYGKKLFVPVVLKELFTHRTIRLTMGNTPFADVLRYPWHDVKKTSNKKRSC